MQAPICYLGTMTRKWAPQTRYTLRLNTASIMKDWDLEENAEMMA